MKTKKEEIVELLKKKSNKLTIIKIFKELRIFQNTMAVALAELKEAERIRPLSRTKLLGNR